MSESISATPMDSGCTEASSSPDKMTSKIGWGEKFGYAAGDMASCLYFGIFMNFMAIFYTDVFGISAAALGTMLFLTRTWDWINDPVMGAIADRTQSKHGTFRPWLIWMAGPYMLLGILTFTTFDLSPTMKLVYAYLSYTLLMMVYTAINVPYGALMGVMTANSDERTELASFRFIGANAGIFVVTLLLPYLVAQIGQGDDQLGYTGAVSVLSIMAGALFFTTFKTCRERIQPEQQEQTSFAEEFKQLKRNGPWLMIILISVMTVMSQAIRACTTLHYFKYVAGQEDWGTQILLYNSLAAVVAVLLSKHYCQKLGGKKRAYIILNILFAIVVSWFYFIPSDQFSMLLANQILLSFVCAPMMPIFWSMIADTADYGAVKLGHRATGVIFSAGTASQKIGWSIGPAVAMWILASSGFEANTIPSDLTKMTLKLEMSLIPAGFAILTAFATLFYSIDSKMEKELEAVLSK